MINLIIVDDEPIIQKGLSRVPWNTIGVNLIKTVGNGYDALKIIQEQHIDILFTDIQMPDINGLELIRAARIINPQIQGVILTGHSDFVYAKEAIALQVFDYILKPCSPKEVLDIIGKLANKIEKIKEQENHLSNSLTLFKENIQKDLLLGYLIGKSISEEKFTNSFSSDFLNSISYLPICVYSPNLMLTEKLYVVLNEQHCSDHYYIFNQSQKQCLLLFYSTNQQKLNIEKLVTILKKCYVQETSLYFGVGILADSFENLPHAYKAAEICAGLFFSHMDTNLLLFDSIKHCLSTVLPQEIIKQLLTGAEHCNYLLIQESLKSLKDYYTNVYTEPSYIRTVIIDLCISVCNLTAQKRDEPFLGLSAEQLLNITSATDLDTLLELTESLFFNCIDILNNAQTAPTSHIVKDCIKYIEEHYQEDINLTKTADAIFISADYLSRILKKELGFPFSQLLINYRLEKSCSLLANLDLSISEVSTKSGFKDFRYFGQAFKSHYHLTPTEYRKTFINRKNNPM